MGDSYPQDVYANCLPNDRGYPLWFPEPSNRLPSSYRHEGLHIGDVGYVSPRGAFEVLFNICFHPHHSLHQRLDHSITSDFPLFCFDDSEIDVVPNADPPDCIITSPGITQPDQMSQRPGHYEFTSFSAGGAILILPDGATSLDVLTTEPFRKVAMERGSDWYTFARKHRGESFRNGSLYLITGFHKARSWSLASFHDTTDSEPRHIRVIPRESQGTTVERNWTYTFPVQCRGGPGPNHNGSINQTIFIRGFKITVRDDLLGFWSQKLEVQLVPAIQPLKGPSDFASFLMWPFGKKNSSKRRRGVNGSTDINQVSVLSQDPNTSVAVTHDVTDSVKMSTTFSAWQEQNNFAVSRSIPYITAYDVSPFRVEHSDQPGTAARSLQKSTKFDIQELVNDFQELGSDDRAKCNDLIRKLPVFACLSVYIFTHLKLCVADKPKLLDSFLLVTKEWINKPEEWCLINYQTIKSDLSSFLEQSKVSHHNCNQQFLDNARLHYLDIHSLAALAIIYSTDPRHVQSFYAMKDNQAQAILDLLQELIDLKSDHLDGWYKRRFLDAVVRLSKKSRLYPRSLNITGIDQVTSTGDRGGFGAIFRGVLSERVVALKELQTGSRTADDYLKDFCQEAVVWRNVHHKNCLPFYGVTNFVADGVPRTCMASPWMTNGNLRVYLSHNPDVPRLPLLLDIASGLEYLHAMQPIVVHGDLKSLNIFVTDSGRACLADFGLATVHDTQVSVSTTAHGIYGTAGYMAPELISVLEDPNGGTLLTQLDRRRCDMFAFGCIAYEVYTGGPPFHGNNPAVRSQMLLAGSRPRRPTEARVHELGLDDDMWTFIENLWAHRPEARPVAGSARDYLRYKSSATGQGMSRPQNDPEWDTGFLSSLPVANDLFSL